MKSESLKELATALAKAQGEIKGAIKDSANPFFKSKYADLSSVVDAIKVAFSKNGLSYIQMMEPSDKDEVRVSTMILHSSGEYINCGILALPVSKVDAQGYGSALTYARRYSLSSAVGVAPEDDDGNAAVAAAPKGMSDNEIARHLQDIEKASSQSELLKAYTKAYKSAQVLSDTKSITMIVKAKNAAKLKFTELVNESA
jgi:hypothetical protein